MAAALRPLAIFGPTGVGKTAVALALADRLRALGEDPVAISADALQVYRGLEALTGAATTEERSRLEHRLVGFLPVDRWFSVGEYAPLAHAEIDAALAAGRRPIVLGGTGLYLRAALSDLDLRPPPGPGVRGRIGAELEARGIEELHADLVRRSPEAATRLDPRDRSRVTRALELLEVDPTADPLPPERSELWAEGTRHPTLLVGVTAERDELYRRIDRRVGDIVAAGAEAEVRAADRAGASPTARKAIGFEELLRGDVEAMRRRTRRYAKRQLTWMRKLVGARVIDVTGREPEAVAEEIAVLLEGAPATAPPPPRCL